jgi:hypothetical protein
MTRDEALQRLEKEKVSESRLDAALKLLRITRQRFQAQIDR